MSDIFPLFRVSAYSVLLTFSQYALGFYLIKRDLITRNTITVIFQLGLQVLLPLLLFVKVARIVSVDVLKENWPLFLLPVLHVAFGYLTAYVLAVFIPTRDAYYKPHFIQSIVFGNSGAVPLSILPPLVKESSYFAQDDLAATKVQGLIAIFLVFQTPLLFTLGWQGIPSGLDKDKEEGEEEPEGNKQYSGEPSRRKTIVVPVDSVQQSISQSQGDGGIVVVQEVPAGNENEEMCISEKGWMQVSDPWWTRVRKSKFVEALLANSNIATCLGVFCGLIDPLRHAMFNPSWPISPVLLAMEALGDAAIPLTNVALGGLLARHLSKHTLSGRTLLLFVFARTAFIPLINVLVTWGLWKGSVLSRDPVVRLVFLMSATVPLANTIVVFADMKHSGREGMATLVLVSYVAFFLTISGWLTLYLAMIFNPSFPLLILQ